MNSKSRISIMVKQTMESMHTIHVNKSIKRKQNIKTISIKLKSHKPDCVEKNVDEKIVVVSRDVSFCQKYLKHQPTPMIAPQIKAVVNEIKTHQILRKLWTGFYSDRTQHGRSFGRSPLTATSNNQFNKRNYVSEAFSRTYPWFLFPSSSRTSTSLGFYFVHSCRKLELTRLDLINWLL